MERTVAPAAFSVDESHRYVGVSRALFYKLLNAGLVQSFHVGTRRLVLKDELDRYIRSRLEAENNGSGS